MKKILLLLIGIASLCESHGFDNAVDLAVAFHKACIDPTSLIYNLYYPITGENIDAAFEAFKKLSETPSQDASAYTMHPDTFRSCLSRALDPVTGATARESFKILADMGNASGIKAMEIIAEVDKHTSELS